MQRGSGRRRPVLTSLVVIALLAGGGYAGWRYYLHPPAEEAKAEEPPQKIPVTVEAAARRDYPVYLDSLGVVEALNTVTVRAQVSGQIVKIAFREGQVVKQGDLLAEIDPRPFQAALDQAEAKLAQDQATLQDAEVILERLRKLAEQQITTRQQFDTQGATVNQLRAVVEGDRAAIDNARTQLGYATIRAPIAGRVGFRLADIGNLVAPSDANGIVTIQQVSPIAVLFTEPERELPALVAALSAGRPPVDALSSDKQRTLAKGELRLLDNTVDAASGTVRAKAVFDNGGGMLWPGMSVTTRLLARTEPGATVIRETAVQRGPEGLFVYVVGEDGKAAMRKVTVADSFGGEAMVTEGVSPGDRVVVDGQTRVEPDALVEAKDAPPREPPQPAPPAAETVAAATPPADGGTDAARGN